MERVPPTAAAVSTSDHSWLTESDGVRVDPEHHRVLVENAAVRVVETRIPTGVGTPVHSHPYRRLLIALSGTTFERHDLEGNVLEEADLAGVGRISWAEPATLHTIRNTGPDDLVVVSVELLEEGRAENTSDSGDGGRCDA